MAGGDKDEVAEGGVRDMEGGGGSNIQENLLGHSREFGFSSGCNGSHWVLCRMM